MPPESRPCARRGCSERVTRPNALFCSPAHRQAEWREKHGYVLVQRLNPLLRRKSRDGLGVRLYVTTAEAESLARGVTPVTVAVKAAAKLKPPDPIPGQTNLIDALAEQEDRHDAP